MDDTLVKAGSLFGHRRKSILIGFAPLLLSIIIISIGQLRAQGTAVVFLEPQSLTLNQGQTRRVVVRIENAADVYGVQMDLSFEPSQIRVVDEDETRPGVQVLSGDFLTINESFEAANEVNNEAGYLFYAYSRLSPAEPVSGSGILFEFEVEALETGSIEFQFDRVLVASPDGVELPVHVGITEGTGGETIFVPNFTATAPAGNRAIISTTSVTSPSPTAEITPQPTVTAADTPESSTNVDETAASPATQTQIPAASQISAEVPTSTIPASPLNGEPEGAEVMSSTAESPIAAATAIATALEISTGPEVVEEENIADAVEEATRPLTVIGENQRLEDTQAQPPTPAPSANREGTIDSAYLAAGLIALSAGLIAIWFIIRIKPR
jgi:hypothetical protein